MRAEDGRILINGVKGLRQDVSRTFISYTLALEPDDDGPIDRPLIDRLVHAFWEDRAPVRPHPHRIAVDIDRALSDEAGRRGTSLDRMLEAGDAQSVARAVLAVATQCPPPPPGQPNRGDLDGLSWIGSDHPGVPGLLLGDGPFAYFAGYPADAEDLSVRPSVLHSQIGLDPGELLIVDGTAETYANPKKALAPSIGVPGNSPSQRPLEDRRPAAAVVAAVVVVVVVSLLMLFVL
jgi:hypothetical protein